MGLISSREGGGFADSLLEQAGFEPSVRRDTINVSKCAHFGSACRNGKGGAKESRYHDDAWLGWRMARPCAVLPYFADPKHGPIRAA
jgi:hypothetical protein